MGTKQRESSMAPAHRAYLKQVKEALHCSRANRKRLLTALDEEISETFPGPDQVAMERIVEEYGPPEEMARELQQVLPESAVISPAKKRLRWICLIILLGLLVVLLIVGGFLR